MMNYNDKGNIAQMLTENAFALYEAVLYLDTHPDDAAAMEFFCRKQKKQQMLREEYNREIGPLTAEDTNTDNGWCWVNDPWPWQV